MTKIEVKLHINGEERVTTIRYADTLLSVLRNQLGLTGSKPGCLNGDCGACTVNIDERPMKSCLILAIETLDKEIMTVEGLENTHLQQAFMEHFAFQCGYCTPGFIMNCYSLLNNYSNPSEGVMKDWLNSNICRCTGYEEIETAIKSVILKE